MPNTRDEVVRRAETDAGGRTALGGIKTALPAPCRYRRIPRAPVRPSGRRLPQEDAVRGRRGCCPSHRDVRSSRHRECQPQARRGDAACPRFGTTCRDML